MLKVKINTVNGIASISVASNNTRAGNHDCNEGSRHAKGRRGINSVVSKATAKKQPSARTGVVAATADLIVRPFATGPSLVDCDSARRGARGGLLTAMGSQLI